MCGKFYTPPWMRSGYFVVKTVTPLPFLAKKWLQGRKKNCVQLCSDRKVERTPKENISHCQYRISYFYFLYFWAKSWIQPITTCCIFQQCFFNVFKPKSYKRCRPIKIMFKWEFKLHWFYSFKYNTGETGDIHWCADFFFQLNLLPPYWLC